MIHQPRPPRAWLFNLLAGVIALALAFGTFSALEPVALDAETLAGWVEGAAEPNHLGRLESRWTEEVFEAHRLLGPYPPLPCASKVSPEAADSGLRRLTQRAVDLAKRGRDVDAITLLRGEGHRWLSVLTAGILLPRIDEKLDAGRIVDRYMKFPVVRENIGRYVTSTKRKQPNTAPSTDFVAGLIHLQYLAGRLRIERNDLQAQLWGDLRYPIALARFLALRGDAGAVPGTPAEKWLPLPTPGCGVDKDSISSHDLYNNLIVGYLTQPFEAEPAQREREMRRKYDDPPGRNPLQAFLKANTETWPEDGEGWLWAVSNAESLLREGRDVRNPRLALNLAAMTREALPDTPVSAKAAMVELSANLLRLAEERMVEEVEFIESLAREKLLTSAGGSPSTFPEAALDLLSPAHQEVLGSIGSSRRLWQRRQEWLRDLIEGGMSPKEDGLSGRRLAEWRQVARRDIAAAIAVRGVDLNLAGRKQTLGIARELLAIGTAEPVELTQLDASLGMARHIPGLGGRATPWLFAAFCALVAAAVIWIASRPLASQLRERRALFTSFYRIEARARLREGKRQD